MIDPIQTTSSGSYRYHLYKVSADDFQNIKTTDLIIPDLTEASLGPIKYQEIHNHLTIHLKENLESFVYHDLPWRPGTLLRSSSDISQQKVVGYLPADFAEKNPTLIDYSINWRSGLHNLDEPAMKLFCDQIQPKSSYLGSFHYIFIGTPDPEVTQKDLSQYYWWLFTIPVEPTLVTLGLPYFYKVANLIKDKTTLTAQAKEIKNLWKTDPSFNFYSPEAASNFVKITKPSIDTGAIKNLKKLEDHVSSFLLTLARTQYELRAESLLAKSSHPIIATVKKREKATKKQKKDKHNPAEDILI